MRQAAWYIGLAAFTLLPACVSLPPPGTAQITHISTVAATVQEWEIMGDYHAESFDVPGYYTRFRVDKDITAELKEGWGKRASGWALDYFYCDTSDAQQAVARKENQPLRPYKTVRSFFMPEKQSGAEGSYVFAAEFVADRRGAGEVIPPKKPVCARIFAHDSKFKAITYRSNTIEIPIPDFDWTGTKPAPLSPVHR